MFTVNIHITKAQTQDNKIITGIEATFVDYKGVVEKETFKPGNFNPGLRLTANVYINKWLNYAITSSFVPKASYPQPFNTGFLPQLLMDFNTGLQLKVNNGTLFKETARFAPYLYTGIGFNTTEGQNSFYIPIALGMRLRLTHTISMNFETMYRQKFGTAIQPRSHSVGFVFVLPTNKPKTHTIADKNTKPTKTHPSKNEEIVETQPIKNPAVISSKPSSHDGDPKPIKTTTPVKPKAAIAIKDRDHDGIADDKDGCPDEYGTLAEGGCPEFAKVEKTKPTTVNPIQIASNGEKDTDGDGIWDKLDGCPNEPGSQNEGGCPLRYAIAQSIDTKIDRTDILTSKSTESTDNNSNMRVSTPTNIEKRGTEKVTLKDIDRLAIIARSIQFVQGTDSLMPNSKSYITELNAILAKYPNHRLEVTGFYASGKDEEANQVMSVLRAHKIKSLLLLTLEQKHIRLKTNGMGSAKTTLGLDKNRLEMKLVEM